MPVAPIALKLTPEAHRLLKHLTENGLFGTSVEDVAERLLSEKLREVVLQGWVGVPGFSDGRTQPLVHR
jgi:hypothetical protein